LVIIPPASAGSVGNEVTESILMNDSPYIVHAVQELKAQGVKLAIDDFDTGFSSLARLKKLPVDVLKIDRSFVDGLGKDGDDEAIVEAVVKLGHLLGLTIVAEDSTIVDPNLTRRPRTLTSPSGYLE
jgi:EAL domain-containing protein (putative c-di-GMP-specific phosphodiesterase class I)